MKLDRPGLKEDRTRSGAVRWRVRMEGNPNRLLTLPMGLDEPGLEDHYLAARAGKTLAIAKPKISAPGSLDDMADRFLAWMETQVAAGDLSRLTLSSRRTGLTQACDTPDAQGARMGGFDPDLPAEAFVHILDAFGERTAAGATCLRALRAMYVWGAERGWGSARCPYLWPHRP